MVEQIRDLYDAEKQLVRALPKMAKAAASDELRQAIEDHLEETNNQVQRLEHRTGIEAESVGQVGTEAVVGTEGVGAPAGLGQRAHLDFDEPLACRVFDR